MTDNLKALAAAFAAAKIDYDAAVQKLDAAQAAHDAAKNLKDTAFHDFNSASRTMLIEACSGVGVIVHPLFHA